MTSYKVMQQLQQLYIKYQNFNYIPGIECKKLKTAGYKSLYQLNVGRVSHNRCHSVKGGSTKKHFQKS